MDIKELDKITYKLDKKFEYKDMTDKKVAESFYNLLRKEMGNTHYRCYVSWNDDDPCEDKEWADDIQMLVLEYGHKLTACKTFYIGEEAYPVSIFCWEE